MSTYCEGCRHEWRPQWQRDAGPSIHKALIIAGSLSNAQRRTLKFEASGTFSTHPENESDITISVGKKALLAFLYEEDRPALALDTWLGRIDSASCSEQMTAHQYTFNVLAIDEATDKEIQRRGREKLYGIPLYIIQHGTMYLRELDPDGSEVKFDIPRIS